MAAISSSFWPEDPFESGVLRLHGFHFLDVTNLHATIFFPFF